jgi:hypothetical protein
MATLRRRPIIIPTVAFRCRIVHSRAPAYLLISLSMTVFFVIGFGGLIFDESNGTIVCARSRETPSAIQIVIPTCLRYIDISLFAPTMLGRKTIAVVMVPAVIASETSLTPVVIDSVERGSAS